MAAITYARKVLECYITINFYYFKSKNNDNLLVSNDYAGEIISDDVTNNKQHLDCFRRSKQKAIDFLRRKHEENASFRDYILTIRAYLRQQDKNIPLLNQNKRISFFKCSSSQNDPECYVYQGAYFRIRGEEFAIAEIPHKFEEECRSKKQKLESSCDDIIMDNPIVVHSEQCFQPIDIVHQEDHEISTNEDTHIEDITQDSQESPALSFREKIITITQQAVNKYTSNSYGSNLRGIVKINNGSHFSTYIQAITAITFIKQIIILDRNDDSETSNNDYAANKVKSELLEFLKIGLPFSFSLQQLIQSLETIDDFEGTEDNAMEFFSTFPVRIFGCHWNPNSIIEISANREINLSDQNYCKICNTNSTSVCVLCILVVFY